MNRKKYLEVVAAVTAFLIALSLFTYAICYAIDKFMGWN